MARLAPLAAVAATAYLPAVAHAAEEPLIWGVKVDRVEYRFGDDTDQLYWEGEALIGTDEIKLFLGSEANFATHEDEFETLETQLRVQMPISDFADITAGVSYDAPSGPDRAYGLIGIRGLAPQWVDIGADLLVADEAILRMEAEYEALITNYLILTPSLEVDLPLTDDHEVGLGAWGPKLEVGARLSYDLIDRSVAPYVGVHYERAFGETASLAREDGNEAGEFFLLTGLRLMF